MSDHGEEENIDLVFGKAIVKGALIGLPLMLVFVSVSVLLMTEESVATSLTTGLLPGVLLGVFGGGFLGSLSVSKH